MLLDHVCSEEFGRPYCFARSGGSCVVGNNSGARHEGACLERDEQCVASRPSNTYRCTKGVAKCEVPSTAICFDEVAMVCRRFPGSDHAFGLGINCLSFGGRCSAGQCINPPGEECGGNVLLCERGLTCEDNVCVLGRIGTSCDDDAACNREQECRNGICSTDVGIGEFCGASGLDCFKSTCVDDFCTIVLEEELEQDEETEEPEPAAKNMEESCANIRGQNSFLFLVSIFLFIALKTRKSRQSR